MIERAHLIPCVDASQASFVLLADPNRLCGASQASVMLPWQLFSSRERQGSPQAMWKSGTSKSLPVVIHTTCQQQQFAADHPASSIVPIGLGAAVHEKA